MCHVQIQKAASRSTTIRAFVFLAKFFIKKYLKQEFHDNLRFISVTWLKGNDVPSPNVEVPFGLMSRNCFYCPNLIQLDPMTRDKEICQSHTNEVMVSVTPKVGYPTELFEWGLPYLMFLASLWLGICRFSNWSFCWIWAVQNW